MKYCDYVFEWRLGVDAVLMLLVLLVVDVVRLGLI
jgi:hypothetical protein